MMLLYVMCASLSIESLRWCYFGVTGKCAGEVSEDKTCVHHFD